MSDEYNPYQWALDAIAFERWFHDQEEINPRIEMVLEIMEHLPELDEQVLTEYFWERLSMRGIMRRHRWTNPWYAHQAVHAALGRFKEAWIDRYGEL